MSKKQDSKCPAAAAALGDCEPKRQFAAKKGHLCSQDIWGEDRKCRQLREDILVWGRVSTQALDTEESGLGSSSSIH